jgi:peroxiredoxin
MRRFLISLFLAGVFASSLSAAGKLSGRRAPSFSLPDINLNHHDILDYRGKIILLEILQTTCPACNSSQKVLETIRLKHGGKVAVISIVVPPDNQQSVQKFIAQNAMKSPVLFDCGQVLASYLKITPKDPTVHFPHLFLIDEQGMIRNDFEYGDGFEKYFESVEPLDKEVQALVNAMGTAPKPGTKKLPTTKSE